MLCRAGGEYICSPMRIKLHHSRLVGFSYIAQPITPKGSSHPNITSNFQLGRLQFARDGTILSIRTVVALLQMRFRRPRRRRWRWWGRWIDVIILKVKLRWGVSDEEGPVTGAVGTRSQRPGTRKGVQMEVCAREAKLAHAVLRRYDALATARGAAPEA